MFLKTNTLVICKNYLSTLQIAEICKFDICPNVISEGHGFEIDKFEYILIDLTVGS